VKRFLLQCGPTEPSDAMVPVKSLTGNTQLGMQWVPGGSARRRIHYKLCPVSKLIDAKFHHKFGFPSKQYYIHLTSLYCLALRNMANKCGD